MGRGSLLRFLSRLKDLIPDVVDVQIHGRVGFHDGQCFANGSLDGHLPHANRAIRESRLSGDLA